MKKTLAAVLAAAMALSTASVAMAKDTLVDEKLEIGNTADLETEIRIGKSVERLIEELGDFGASELAELMDDGYITVSTIVTEGSNKLDGKPSVKVFRRKTNTPQETKDETYSWADDVVDAISGKTLFKADRGISTIPVYRIEWKDGNSAGLDAGTRDWVFAPLANNESTDYEIVSKLQQMKSTHSEYKKVRGILEESGYINETAHLEDGTAAKGNKVLKLSFKVADTFDTSSPTVGMKLRITVKKSFTSDVSGESYKKGDTYTTDEFRFKAKYGELDYYGEDMELTLQEVDDRNVLFDASDLYDEIGADNFRITFEDNAVFEAKLSASQKDVNLFYNLDEITQITEQYPEANFEFIKFRGTPSFVNSGTMTFPAIGGKKTVVYTFDGEALNPLDQYTTYDPTYNTVKVKNVKKLETFVVASEMLEEEVDEPAEPVSSAPVVEGPEEDENPKTGAC